LIRHWRSHHKHQHLPPVPIVETNTNSDSETEGMDSTVTTGPPNEEHGHQETSTEPEDDSNYDYSDEVEDTPAPDHLVHVEPPANPVRPESNHFSDAATQFSTWIKEGNGEHHSAISRLIYMACNQTNDGRHSSCSDSVPHDWAVIFLSLSQLVVEIGPFRKQLLSDVVMGLVAKINFNESNWLPIPLCVASFRSKITNREKSSSLMSNMPIPQVRILDEAGHACCHIQELAAFSLMFPDMKADRFQIHPRFHSLIRSKKFREFTGKMSTCDRLSPPSTPILVLFSVFWSDGWDPNQSNKRNRSPVHSSTVTFICVDMTDSTPYYIKTQLISSGPGKADHEVVFQSLLADKRSMEDENGLSKGMVLYSSEHKKNVLVHIYWGPFLQDQPERRDISGHLAGNSRMHPSYGLSCDFQKLDRPFPACEECEQSVCEYLNRHCWKGKHQRTCPHCYGWSFDILEHEGVYTSPATNLDLEPSDPGYLLNQGPGRFTFKDCLEAWDFAFEKFAVAAQWSETSVKAYLGMYCLKHDLVARFVEHSRLYMEWEEMSTRTAADGDRTPTPGTGANHTNGCKKPEPPAMWHLTTICQIIETPMHLLLGIQKAFFQMIPQWASRRSKATEWVSRGNVVVGMVTKCAVAICKTRAWKNEKHGGWVAETFTGATMTLPWSTSIFNEESFALKELTPPPDPATKPQAKWKKEENASWLKIRGLPCHSKMPAKELKATVAEYMRLPASSLPPIRTTKKGSIPPSVIRDLALTLYRMCAAMMCTDLSGHQASNRLSALTMVFLSKYDRLDLALNPKRDKPVWLSKFNFLSLIRAPQHFLDHRHIRNLHEGGSMGEANVKPLRELVPKGLRGDWARILVETYYRRKLLNGFRHSIGRTELVVEDTELQRTFQAKFRRYRSRAEVKSHLTNGDVLSVLVYGTDSEWILGAVVSYNNHWTIMELELSQIPTRSDIYGHPYYGISLVNSRHDFQRENMRQVGGRPFLKAALICPDLWTNRGDRSGLYDYCVTAEGMQRLDGNREWSST
jgi:hypothetical protein